MGDFSWLTIIIAQSYIGAGAPTTPESRQCVNSHTNRISGVHLPKRSHFALVAARHCFPQPDLPLRSYRFLQRNNPPRYRTTHPFQTNNQRPCRRQTSPFLHHRNQRLPRAPRLSLICKRLRSPPNRIRNRPSPSTKKELTRLALNTISHRADPPQKP